MKSITNGWKFGNVILSSFGHITELDSYLDIPPKRGGNIFIPFQDGNVHVPKFFDQKVISFGMEIVSDGVCDLEEKLDNLKMLLGVRGQQYLSNTMFQGGERRALAEVVTQLGVTRGSDPRVARVVIDFLLSGSFLRSAVLTSVETTINSTPKTFTINNPGTADERTAIITLTGPLDHAIITNTTNSIAVEYNNDLAGAGNVVVINCGTFATIPAGAIADIIHTGDTAFMVLAPGDNAFSVVSTGGHTTGKIKFEFYAPFL